MPNKSLDKQHRGALTNISGNRYEANFFVHKLVEMLIQSSEDEPILSVTRSKKGANVDDVCVNTRSKKISFQCKEYAKYEKGLLKDFLLQYEQSTNSYVFLITQNKVRYYSELTQDARKFNYKTFLEYLTKDGQLRKHKDAFDSLCSVIKEAATNPTDVEYYAYNFLRQFSIEVFDNTTAEKNIKERLVANGYTREEAERIYNKLYARADSYEWQGVEVTEDILKEELKSIDVKSVPDKTIPIEAHIPVGKQKKKRGPHILQDLNAPFFKKLSFLIDFISNLGKPRQKERKQVIEILKKDNTLAWHFFKNLKNDSWFIEIKDTLIKSITTQKGDAAVKIQLIDFLTLCTEKYSDKIIPLLAELESNTKSHNALSSIIKILPRLKPREKSHLSPIWRMLRMLSEHQHPWVRKEIPAVLKVLAEHDINKSLKLLEKLILFTPPPRDVTQGSPTLALTFQGRDNENWVFGEAARVLSELMLDSRFSIKAFSVAIKLEIHYLKGKKEKLDNERGFTLDHSYIWLHDNDPIHKVEYEYEGKRRFALEMQKCLDVLSTTNMELAKELFDKLLQYRYEVLHLAVIKTLIKNPAQYLNLIEKIVFDKNLWIVHTVRDYYLQTLIQKYFEIKQDRLFKFTQSARSFKYNNDIKRTNYIKQALLVSVPENLRTEKTNEDLKQLENKLRAPARIEKSYSITSWSGPKPDISLDDLRRKSIDDLVQIMMESTAGRRADPYDLSGLFADLIKEQPDKLPVLIDRMVGNNIAPDFSGKMVSAYKEIKQSEPMEIFNVFWKLEKTDTWARIEIARYLNKLLRKEEPPTFTQNQLEEVKRVLFDLAGDENPDNDDSIKSNSPRPEDAITRGINSVRGIAVEALAALYFYFPNDNCIAEKLRSLSKDPTNAVKATLIYNLRYLIGKDYRLCKSIVQQFKDIRDPEIDFALIHYFSYLGTDKFKSNLALIKDIFRDTNEGIQELLGNLVGSRWIDGFNVKDLINGIIKQSIGEKSARQALAFIFESRLAGQIGVKKHKRIFYFLIPLLDPFSEPDIQVRERASFALSRDELKAEVFKILYDNKIFDTILKDTSNIHAQSHIIKYLSECVFKDMFISKCVELLHKQTMNIEGIWDDHLIVQKISNILRHIFMSPKIDRKTMVLANEIFDKGLERGWEEFYNLFSEFKQPL